MKIKNEYSLFDIIKLLVWLIRTKLICIHARLIRFPIDIRGGKYIDWGKRLTTGKYCRIEAFNIDGTNTKRIIFGNNVQINDNVHICSMKEVKIGNDVLIAGHVYISDNSHGIYSGTNNDSSPLIPPINREYKISSTSIGENTWIGEGVIILPGVQIGKGVIIGAHSIVNKNIPDYTMAVGSPIRIIKKFNFSNNSWEKIEGN